MATEPLVEGTPLPPPPVAPSPGGAAARPALDTARFPVVGIGASAGGLAAFEAFFSGMPIPTEPGMAFVLVQHLAPDHKSLLTDILRRYTRMQICEVADGMAIQSNCAYIIPPNRDMALLNGTLQLLEPVAPRGQRLPIDFFFRSLAQDQHEFSIGIVLSGTGSDGTQGVRAIKGEGGMVMAQTPGSSEYDGMPRSALATGLVDYELPPAEMPAQLLAYVTHAFGGLPRPATAQTPSAEHALQKVFALLRAQTRHDFSQYKPNTIHRRIERRMAVRRIDTSDGYVTYLQQTPVEVDALFRDLLIGVTSFFRDPAAFTALEEQGIPTLFAGKPAGGGIRAWVPGCSTGEEAYAIAILLQERLDALTQDVTVQVFATDIDPRALETARAGRYPASIAADITPERLARFFVAEPDGNAYRIQKRLRDLLVFSEQDVLTDPPFSRLDLISCRNLLIYLDGDVQRRLLPLFHYALNPGGLLFLGTSETVGESADLFGALDRPAKLYTRKADLPTAHRPALGTVLPFRRPHEAAGPRRPGKVPLRELTERAILLQIVPVAALVTARGDLLYLHGRTGRYLEPASGTAGVPNILSMAREGLRRALTTALHTTARTSEIVRCPGLRVKTNGEFTVVNLTVYPVATDPAAVPESPLYLILLEEASPGDPGPAPQTLADAGGPAEDAAARVAALTQELRAKDDYLQAANEEMETANEELTSANEELQSVNEELQSTNEELETSKEELQSTNEELVTVNSELQTKVADLLRANNDMANLLAGTGIGTIFVDPQLCILRFTPAVTPILPLLGTDLGRPIAHIVSTLVGYDRLVVDIQAVLDTLVPTAVEVQTRAGAWYTLRLQPYRTLDNVVEGVVLTFEEITALKALQAQLEATTRAAQAAQLTAEHVLDTVPMPMLVLKADLRVLSANAAYCALFRTTPDATLGQGLADLGDGYWKLPALHRLLDDILPHQTIVRGFAVTVAIPGRGPQDLRLHAREVRGGAGGGGRLILLALEDVPAP
jgi:two-component system, chemotaxis family, CheB/CheR fusion protein